MYMCVFCSSQLLGRVRTLSPWKPLGFSQETNLIRLVQIQIYGIYNFGSSQLLVKLQMVSSFTTAE